MGAGDQEYVLNGAANSSVRGAMKALTILVLECNLNFHLGSIERAYAIVDFETARTLERIGYHAFAVRALNAHVFDPNGRGVLQNCLIEARAFSLYFSHLRLTTSGNKVIEIQELALLDWIWLYL